MSHKVLLKLDAETNARLQRLSAKQGMPADQIALDVVKGYLDRMDRLDALDLRAAQALAEYKTTGVHVTAEEADAWLAELEAGNDVEPPECHA